MSNGNIIGGLIAVLCWNWIEVDILWVDSSFRFKGTGTQLLNEVEKIAFGESLYLHQVKYFQFPSTEFLS